MVAWNLLRDNCVCGMHVFRECETDCVWNGEEISGSCLEERLKIEGYGDEEALECESVYYRKSRTATYTFLLYSIRTAQLQC